MNRSAYIAQLDRQVAENLKAQAAFDAELNKPLTLKIREWWETLPDEEKYRPYSMCELVEIFKVAPGRLGISLIEAGWSRFRSWRAANYRRWWRAG